MENFASYLKAQREKKGIRLEEIASITKIHLHSLELLEAGKWDRLPPEPFIRGFIIAYAKYVGLEPKEAIKKYLEEVHPQSANLATENTEDPSATPSAGSSISVSDPAVPHPTATEVIEHAGAISSKKVFAAIGGFALLFLMVGIIYIGKKSSQSVATSPSAPKPEATTASETKPATENKPTAASDSRSVASPPKATPQATAPATTTAPAVAAAVAPANNSKSAGNPSTSPQNATTPTTTTAASAPAEGQAKHEVLIEGKERTWIKVVIDDKAPIEYFLPEGERAKYSAQNKIKVVLGNATGSKITHNGEVAEGRQFQGTIRSYIFPSNARFPQDVPARKTTEAKPAESEITIE